MVCSAGSVGNQFPNPLVIVAYQSKHPTDFRIILLELGAKDTQDEKAQLAVSVNKHLCYSPQISAYFSVFSIRVWGLQRAWGSNFEPLRSSDMSLQELGYSVAGVSGIN